MLFKIKHIKETVSTNTLAIQEAKKGAAEGLVIWADHQTGGRGQFERKWISPPGKNLLFSILLRPPITPAKAPIITQLVCQSVLKILRDLYEIESSIKRPNDVLVNGKKICGILTEASTGTNKELEHVIVGIGLNVNALQEELIPEATSVTILKGKTYSRERLLKSLLNQLKKDLKPLYASHS